MSDEIRRLPRYPADWPARFRLDPAADWRTCRLINISWEGAGLELDQLDDDEPLVGSINVEIRSVTGDDEGVDVRSRIRHATKPESGRATIGIEFEPLEEEQHQLLRLLISLRAAV